MKKAINQWCFPSHWPWERVFALCRQTGFEGIELCVDYLPFFEAMRSSPQEGLIADIARSVGSSFVAGKALRFDSPEAEFTRVAALARDHGVAVSSLLTIAQFHYSLIHEDAGVRATGIDLMKRLIDLAVLTGAPNLLVVPGVVTSRIGYEDAYRRLREAIGILKEDAEKKGVGLGIENVWGVPWERVMRALQEVQYAGYLIAEVPPYPFCPEEGIRDISRKIDILRALA